jgi:molybdopterin-binding protein|tara:strand:+ start:78 stop:281 length:204 start_codon:yes stop_codon:yes gene_type:complete
MLSARNQIKGKVKSAKLGKVMAEVVIDARGIEIVSLISLESAQKMNLKAGDEVTAVIKSTDVIVAKD